MTAQASLFPWYFPSIADFPQRAQEYPQLRYMGSKHRLLPWLHEVLQGYSFGSVLDAFSGSGCVAYLLKAMGKRVYTNDFLAFPREIAAATIENPRHRLTAAHCDLLLEKNKAREDLIERTYSGIFYTPEDLRFLDNVWANLDRLPTRFHRSLALASLIRACVKRQPRGVFTVSGTAEQYNDGRRDLKLTLREHFLECAEAYNDVIFDNGLPNKAYRADILTGDFPDADLVYMDPPYVPRADDNCYIKRYHFLEGLATYWRDPESQIRLDTKVRKIAKRYTPFSYRHSAADAFDRMFCRFRRSVLVLSYSSNGYPDLDTLKQMMGQYKKQIEVYTKEHRYHFGTHASVSADRAVVQEYLIIGT